MSHGREHPAALPYLPALDGLRGLAIAAVLVFHLDRSWLPGGMLGITVFFTLSGFLITSLILREIDTTGGLDLRAFWLRRARRLVPASLAAVGLIALLAALADTVVDRGLIGDAVGALTWTANWRFVADGTSYADLFQDPSPFQHFWSLAVEEQLYVLLPLLALGLLGRAGRRRGLFAVVLLGGIAAATAAGVALHEPGSAPGRAYFGTDVRIAEPLVGALLAVIVTGRGGVRRFAPLGRHLSTVGGALGLVAVGWLMWNLSTGHASLHRGGLLVTALAAALVVTAATQQSVLSSVLGVSPLVALGRISYGVYLFHWPLFLYIDDRMRGSDRLSVAAVQLSTTLVLAAVSHALLEQPIRLRARSAPVFAVGWANGAVAVIAAVALAAGAVGATAGAPVDLGVSADEAAAPPPVAGPTGVASAPPAAVTGEVSRAVPVVGESAAAPAPGAEPTAPVADVADDPVVGERPSGSSAAAPPSASGSELRVAVLGDSLGHNVATGLTSWAGSRGDVLVYNMAISACPMSRGGERRFDESGETFPVNGRCAWWDDPFTDRAGYYQSFDPDIVVVEASLNELLDRRLPEWEEWRRPGDPGYHQWLIDEYNRLFGALRSMSGADTDILLLNAPCADFDRHERWRRVENADDRPAQLNRQVFPLLVEADHGDLFAELCPNGQYSDDLWGIDDARPDGIHLSDEAATELAWRWLGPLVIETASDDDGSLIAGP